MASTDYEKISENSFKNNQNQATNGFGNIAIVGGTGFEALPPDIFAEPMEITTRFGAAHVLSVSNNYVEPYKLYFLSRHGASHGLAPHQINYRANTEALVQLGVKYVYATNAVGSLRKNLPPDSLILLDDFIDFTHSRPLSYFQDGEDWSHVDFSVPYSETMRKTVIDAAHQMNIPLVKKGTYVCCDGPRFESPAEVRLFAQWEADVVGMTGLPEVTYAREAGMEYAALGIVTNYGSGLTSEKVDHFQVTQRMQMLIPIVREMLLAASGQLIEDLTRE